MKSSRNKSRAETEQALRDSEVRYRRLFETAQDGILILDAKTGAIEDANPYLIELLGYAREEFVEKKLWEVGAFKDVEARKDVFLQLREKKYIRYENLPLKAKDGRLVEVEFVSNVYQAGDKAVIQCNIRNITARTQAQRALAVSDDKLRALFAGMTDVVIVYDADGRYLTIGPTDPVNLRRPASEMLGKTVSDFFPPDQARFFLDHIRQALKTGRLSDVDYSLRIGEQVRSFSAAVSPFSSDTVIWVAHDITERKRAEEALKNSETRFRSLIENGLDNISLVAADGALLWESPAVVRTLGYRQGEFVGDNMFELLHPDDLDRTRALLAKLIQEPGSRQSGSFRLRHKDGTWRWVEAVATNLLHEPSVNAIVINYHDITERTLAEQAVRESEQHFRSLFENMLDGYAHCRMIYQDGRPWDFVYLDVNTAFETLTGLKNSVGRKVSEVIPGIQESNPELFDLYGRVASTGLPGKLETYVEGLEIWFSISAYCPKQGEFVAVFENITERKRAEANARRHIDHLMALSEIDRAISSSFDLHFVLFKLLAHVTGQLGVDATDILVLNASTDTLEYATGIGFRTTAFQHTRLRWGQGFAGTAALERRTVQATNLRTHQTDLLRSPNFKSEEFDAYFGLPLIVKGKVLGVLEVFQRSPLDLDQEWLDFLNTLAGQAAIAIDNARLFEHLQRSNFALALAYDATLEGWSRALDLRDKDTEGHTQRVAAACVKLARGFGLEEEELENVRRGGLLHDIGKMGVPDSILLKPGPLTDEEWVVMKKHPAVAYELLSPIEYLRPALDIPYCHHEKWDGTGYPRALQGEQIPVAARIFAVVDVWDALTSDRPYRKAWTEEQSLEYIQSQSGSHFDPHFVEVFLEERSRD